MTSGRKHRLFTLWRDDVGAAMVEFTLLAPFLLFLGFGMTEFGRFLYQYQMVVEGLRDAGRYLARLDPTDTTNQDNAANLAVTGTIDGTGDPRVDGWEADDISFVPTNVTNDDGTGNPLYRGPATIQVIEVTTTFNYNDVGFLSALGLPAISISAAHEQRVIKE
jgi:Flp pilus assembly protein TadG